MRAFIAITLPPEIRNFLAKVQSGLKDSQAEAAWVKPENIHLTLKFLGEINQDQMAEVILIIAETAKNTKPFQIHLSSLGAFPDLRFPRVIWAGIHPGNQETKEIFRILEDKLEKIGFPKEKKEFSAHITLGRMKSNKNLQALIRNLNIGGTNLGKKNQFFPVKDITFFQSRLSPLGPSYTVLKETALKTT